MELIDKAIIVEEIEKYKGRAKPSYYGCGRLSVCEDLLKFLDTLEVKEVDLEEATINYLLHEHTSPLNEVFHQLDIRAEMQYHKDIDDAFKAGFELGIKSKGE